MTNVGVVALGFDFPELECVILGRPSISLALFYQQVGRAVRPYPAKANAKIVDMVGLVQRFGRVEDLVVRQGGDHGTLWEIASGDRPLTNTYFAAGDPATAARNPPAQ